MARVNLEDVVKPYLCIYHHNCADGFGAAWVVRRALGVGEVDFYPGRYQQPPPLELAKGRHVLIVDFSYRLKQLQELGAVAQSVTVLDHHKTAAEDLAPFTDDATPHRVAWMGLSFDAFAHEARMQEQRPIRALFDMNRSGAGIAWDYLFPTVTRPRLIDVLEDRDLWRFKLHETREVQANVFSYPYDFEVWDLLFRTSIEALRRGGNAIERKHHKDVAELVTALRRMVVIGDVRVPAASLPYTYTSDAGHLMALGSGTEEAPEFPFAACYWDNERGRVFSLRSAKGGADVSEVAKRYGGGGHRAAAGFEIPRMRAIAWEQSWLA